MSSRGHNGEVSNMVDASPATRLFVVDSQRGRQLVRAGDAGAPEVFNIAFGNAFAHAHVHDV